MVSETATLGSIVKTVGLKGELKLLPGPDFWTGALGAQSLDLVSSGDVRRAVTVERYRTKGRTYIIKFSEIRSIDEAEPVVGSRLDVSTSELDGSILPEDIRPFQVVDVEVRLRDGTVVGRVADVLVGPVQNCLIVDAGDRRIPVPAVPEVLVEVRVEDGYMVIDPPAGLLDLDW